MARIKTYAVKPSPLNKRDKWIGTSSNGNLTKNFSLEEVGQFLGQTDFITVIGQNIWQFQHDNGTRQGGKVSLPGFGGVNTPLSGITAIKLSEVNSTGTYVVDYLNTLVGKHIIFVEAENHNNFVVALLDSLSVDPGDPDYLDATLTVVESNGNFTEDAFYAIGVYPAEYDTLDSVAERGAVTDVSIQTGGLLSDGALEVSEGFKTTLSDDLEIKDNFPVINSGATGTPSGNAGIIVNRGDEDSRGLRWEENEDRWEHQRASGSWAEIGVGMYEHDQGIPAPVWIITHNLEKFPSVTVTDTSGTVLMGQIEYNSTNQLTITFASSTGGKAYLN